MISYERTLSVQAPADAVFGYVSDTSNVPAFLPEAQGAELRSDPQQRNVAWAGDHTGGSIQVDTGDVTSSLSEITLSLTFNDRHPSDVPSLEDEKTLEQMDSALESIRKHVEHAHRTRKANFM